MSEELPPQEPSPDVEQQLGPPDEPQQEQDQTDITEGDEGERLSDLEERQGEVGEALETIAQSIVQEPLGPVFPARFDTSGNFQELCVVNGSLSDMTGGRSSSGWTGIPLGAGQGFVVECEDYDAANSRSKMQFLLLGANTNSSPFGLATITGHTGTGPTSWNPYQIIFADSSTANAYNGCEPVDGSPGKLGATVGTNGTVNGGTCHVKPIGGSTTPVVWDTVNSRWTFALTNMAE